MRNGISPLETSELSTANRALAPARKGPGSSSRHPRCPDVRWEISLCRILQLCKQQTLQRADHFHAEGEAEIEYIPQENGLLTSNLTSTQSTCGARDGGDYGGRHRQPSPDGMSERYRDLGSSAQNPGLSQRQLPYSCPRPGPSARVSWCLLGDLTEMGVGRRD